MLAGSKKPFGKTFHHDHHSVATDIVLVKSNPLDVAAIMGRARATYSKMIQNLVWATGYNDFAIPSAAGVFALWGHRFKSCRGSGVDVRQHSHLCG